MYSKYDNWLSNQKWSPIHHTDELIEQEAQDIWDSRSDDQPFSNREKTVYALAYDNYDEMKCKFCNDGIGNTLYWDDDGGVYLTIAGFWQMDEDCEHLLCENCYEKNISEPRDGE